MRPIRVIQEIEKSNIMGIFAEEAWCMYDMINKEENSLTAYYSSESSWHLVITRQNPCLDEIPFEKKMHTGPNTWTISTPDQRVWGPKKKKDFSFYAVYVVPWCTYDDGDGTYGMIKMINNQQDKYMTRLIGSGNHYMKIHKFLSSFQYPFLGDIQKIQNVFLFFHQRKFKKWKMDRQIIAAALRPDKLAYYLSLGHSIEDLCDY